MALEGLILVGLIIGIIAYVIEFLGKGIQKYSIEGWKVEKTVKSKHTGYFILGTIMTLSYVFIQWVALLFAPINLIAPLEGLGLVVLIIFSYFVLKEEISKSQIIAIILILLGTVLITIFNQNPSEIEFADFNQASFLIFSIVLVIIEFIAILISKFNGYKGAGLIIGITAGTFMALQTVTKRISALPDPTITITFLAISFGLSVVTFIFTQFAFTKANANIVVPCFSSASIIFAIIIGIIALNEQLSIIQIFGIVIIIVGVILLTAFKKEAESLKEIVVET